MFPGQRVIPGLWNSGTNLLNLTVHGAALLSVQPEGLAVWDWHLAPCVGSLNPQHAEQVTVRPAWPQRPCLAGWGRWQWLGHVWPAWQGPACLQVRLSKAVELVYFFLFAKGIRGVILPKYRQRISFYMYPFLSPDCSLPAHES